MKRAKPIRKSRLMKAQMAATFQYPEAYTEMTYRCNMCHMEVRIYNMRNGMTPLLLTCWNCRHIALYHVEPDKDVKRPSSFTPIDGAVIFTGKPEEPRLATWPVDTHKGENNAS